MSALARIGTAPVLLGGSAISAPFKSIGETSSFGAGVKEAWQTAAKPTLRHAVYCFEKPTSPKRPRQTQWITYSLRPKSRRRIKGNFETWTQLGLFNNLSAFRVLAPSKRELPSTVAPSTRAERYLGGGMRSSAGYVRASGCRAIEASDAPLPVAARISCHQSWSF
jgi:hypothetical protein